MDNYSNKPDDLNVFETIQKIKDGQLNPTALSKEARHLCVEALFFEGYLTSSIAKLFNKSDRTIRRDIEEIREKNALNPNPELSRILTGELLENARSQYSRLKQLARLPETSPEVKAKIEFLAWKVYSESIDILNYVGFLPKDEIKKDVVTNVNNADEDANLSEKDRKLKRYYSLMTPMDRQKLIERLDQEIMENNLKAHDDGQDNKDEENGEGEPLLKE